MQLGTGIFLSALVLGAIILFLATKDRWRWKRIMLWGAGGLGAVCAVIAAGVYGWFIWDAMPRTMTQLWDVKLGSTKDDVKFLKGLPTDFVGDGTDKEIWRYIVADNQYLVSFRDGKVRYILYFGSLSHAPTIKGISVYDPPESWIDNLGEPEGVTRTNNGLSRTYSFARYNVVGIFEKGTLVGTGIYDSSTGPFRLNDQTN